MTTLDAPRERAQTQHARLVVPYADRIRAVSSRGWWDRWWIAGLVLPLMVVSDWKVRHRASADALGGQADAQVLVEIATYGVVAVYLALRHGVAPRLRRTTPVLFTMWFLGAALFCSSFYAVYPTLAIARGVQLLITCALAQTIATHARPDHLHRFVHAYLVLVSFAVPLGFVAQFKVSNNAVGRFHWLYVHPVPGAIYLMIACVAALAYLRSYALRSVLFLWPRWVYGVVAGLTGLGLVLTKTRGSIVGAVLALLVLAVLETRARTKIDVMAFLTMLVAAIAITVGTVIIAYLERGEGISKLSTLNERTNLWALAWQKFQARPLFGYGLGASRGVFLSVINLGGGHNALVNVMVDAGLFGTLPFLALLAIVGALLSRLRRMDPGRRDVLLLLPIFIGLVANSVTAEFMAVPANNANLWLLVMVAWIAVLQRAHRSIQLADAPH